MPPAVPHCLRPLLLGLLLLLVSPATATASPWAQPDRGLYANWTIGYSTATSQYKEQGQVLPLLSEDIPGSFSSMASLLYAEFGLLPRLTLFGDAALQSLVLDSDLQHARTTGLSDVGLGLRYQFLDRRIVASAYAETRLPTGYTADPATMVPTLGAGVPALGAGLSLGASLWPIPAYFSASTAYRLRGSRQAAGGDLVDFADEIPFRVEAGYSIFERFMFRASLHGVFGLGDPQALDVVSLSPLTQSYLKVNPGLIITVTDHLQVNLDYLWTPWGINTVRSHDVLVGLAIQSAP